MSRRLCDYTRNIEVVLLYTYSIDYCRVRLQDHTSRVEPCNSRFFTPWPP